MREAKMIRLRGTGALCSASGAPTRPVPVGEVSLWEVSPRSVLAVGSTTTTSSSPSPGPLRDSDISLVLLRDGDVRPGSRVRCRLSWRVMPVARAAQMRAPSGHHPRRWCVGRHTWRPDAYKWYEVGRPQPKSLDIVYTRIAPVARTLLAGYVLAGYVLAR